MGGWLENWRVIPISAFNYVIVEVVAEIGNILQQPRNFHNSQKFPWTMFARRRLFPYLVENNAISASAEARTGVRLTILFYSVIKL